MNIAVLTIFPELIDSFWAHGIVRRAVEFEKISVATVNIRDFADGRHKEVDDRPYGGGNGMVMKPEPLASALRAAKETRPAARTVLLTPRGELFTQQTAATMARAEEDLILICGRYEGVDERVCREFVDHEISLGDFILTGGEVAAMTLIEAVIRLLPGVLGGAESAVKESFDEDLLEHDHYTRPAEFENQSVPEVLLSGNHAKIAEWRRLESLKRTFLTRPDLLKKKEMSNQDKENLKSWGQDMSRDLEALLAR